MGTQWGHPTEKSQKSNPQHDGVRAHSVPSEQLNKHFSNERLNPLYTRPKSGYSAPMELKTPALIGHFRERSTHFHCPRTNQKGFRRLPLVPSAKCFATGCPTSSDFSLWKPIMHHLFNPQFPVEPHRRQTTTPAPSVPTLSQRQKDTILDPQTAHQQNPSSVYLTTHLLVLFLVS